MAWTPKIVGGTDYDDNAGSAAEPTSETFVFATDASSMLDTLGIENIIETSHEWLESYVSAIPDGIHVEWDYGPVERIPDGAMIRQGQYVVEKHDGEHHQTYWIPC